MKRTNTEILDDLRDFLIEKGAKYEISRVPIESKHKKGVHYDVNWVVTIFGANIKQFRLVSNDLTEIEETIKRYLTK